MFTKDQLESQLKGHAKSAIFERDFVVAFNKYLGEKRDGASKTYADKVNWKEYRLTQAFVSKNLPFTVEGDDNKLHQTKWGSFLRDTAFYFDLPTLHEQREMRFKLQKRYDDLMPSRPPLTSRKELVQWTCEARNAYFQERNAAEGLLEDCANYNQLLKKYGPDYEALKPKLGYVRGLFDANQ
jgi:hypothetical protein